MMTSTLDSFSSNLFDKEYSPVTVSKYLHDVSAFLSFAGNEPITKSLVLRWRQEISATHQVSSVNSMISAVNCWLTFLGLDSCRIKLLKTQPSPYCSETKILTIKEYNRLLEAAGKNTRLRLLIQTIATTGIRISELRFFTVEAVQRGEAFVSCKKKTRRVPILQDLRKLLLHYARQKKISSGPIFCTKTGKPIDRSNIWSALKRLARKACVLPSKVFPHNLRKLFALSFYEKTKDIAKLADVLGHSSISTTRIYIKTSGKEHRRIIESLKLTEPLDSVFPLPKAV